MNGNETIEKGQVITGDLLFNGDQLVVDGEIKGDLMVWSGQVIVNGRIDGSILGVAWDKLIINGEVLGNVRGLANEMRVVGKIDGSITAVAAQLNTSANSLIEQGILGMFSKVNLQGTVNGAVDLNSAPLTRIGGHINGNLKTQGVPITWQVPLEITGTVNDYSGVDSDPTKVKGIILRQGYRLHQPEIDSSSSGIITMISIVWFIGSLLATLILYRLFPQILWMITEPSRTNFRRSMLIGLISLIGIPIVTFILIMTVVGIPLAVLLGLIYLLILLFFGIPINLWLGRLVFRSRFHPSLMIVLAGLLWMLISFIPVINMAVLLVFLLLGMGMFIGNIRPQIFERKKLDVKM
jgi:cytoskeletal protein CcmA (bactofilin family)